jgi:hypothetical protein
VAVPWGGFLSGVGQVDDEHKWMWTPRLVMATRKRTRKGNER